MSKSKTEYQVLVLDLAQAAATRASSALALVHANEDTMTIDSISGKAFGQTLSYKLKEPKD